MKKFSKLIAVVLAIAVIICPMMSVVSHATTTNGYKIEANPNDANELMLTISSTDGFVAYDATVTFNSPSAFQSTYGTGEYVNGLRLISREVKGGEANSHNLPTISSNMTNDTTLKVIVIKDDFTGDDLYTKLVIGIRVAAGSTATLTKIQAADQGTVAEDSTLLTFPAANASTGEIDQTDEYAKENATITVHTHDLTLVSAKDATCTEPGNDAYYTCSCGKIFKDSEGNTETTLEAVTIPATGHTPVTDKAVDPTCTETGLTVGSHCSVCNTVLVAQETVPVLGHAYTYHANGNGTHTVGCGRCDYSAQEACDTEGTDGACSKCGYKAAPAHEHTWIVDTITQPTKTSTGLRTWKCSDPDCHETKEPDVLAIPTYVAATKVFESCDLCVDEAVYPRIAITNANVFSVSGADSYYLVVDYDKFASTDVAKYVKRTESVTFNMSDKTGQNKNGSKWYYALHDIPIYGMGNQFQVTIYMVKDGVATGYWESQPTCIAALAEASYGLVDTLDRCLADLVQYGNELLKYFAYNYPDSDLSKAPLLDTYFSHLDDATSLDLANIPYTSVNNSSALTETNIKLVGSTNVIIGDSNQIRYRVSVPLAYDTSKLTAIVHYNNGYGNEVSKTYTTDNMTFFRTTATANEYYIYFTNCALYDLEKTLTIDVYYDEVKQYTNAYTLGTYVNNNSTVTTAGLDNVVKALGISYESVKSHLFATKPYITD